jgi:hypothetical protein
MTTRTKHNEPRTSEGDHRRDRVNRREVLPPLIGLVISSISLQSARPDAHGSTWNILWWLSPAIFFVGVLLAGARGFSRADELQQRIQLESMAIGFATAMAAAFTFLLLDAADINVRHVGEWVSLVGGLTWAAALSSKTLRSR